MLSIAKSKEILKPELNLNDEEIKEVMDYLDLIANIIKQYCNEHNTLLPCKHG